MELIGKIDLLYTTSSNEGRRETMGELNQYFTQPRAWEGMLSLLQFALNSPNDTGFAKRRHRVCFFAANAMLSKIKRNELASPEERQTLAQAVHSVLFTNELEPRDGDGKLLGKPCTKRLVLCLAYLTRGNQEYIDHACALVMMQRQGNNATTRLGLEMLHAVAGGEEVESDVASVAELPQLAQKCHQVLHVLQQHCQTARYSALLLDVLHAWVAIWGNTGLMASTFPHLFRFALDSIVVSAQATHDDDDDNEEDLIRTSSSLIQCIAECPNATEHTRNQLQDTILQTRQAFAGNTGEDVQQAIASAFAQIAESDYQRIARTRGGPMFCFAVEILSSHTHNRSAVAKNVIDFFLAVLDLPLSEIGDKPMCLEVLHALLNTCQYGDGDNGEDVLMFREAGDGPKDLFVALYVALQHDYVRELTHRVGASSAAFEVALFGLRCASEEICEDGAANQVVLGIFAPNVLQRAVTAANPVTLPSEMFYCIGAFAAMMTPTEAFTTFDALVPQLARNSEACGAMNRLAKRHATLYAPYCDKLVAKVLLESGVFYAGNPASKKVGEALMCIAVEHSPNMCSALIEGFLRLPKLDVGYQCAVLAWLIRPLPQEARAVQAVLTAGRFWDFWDFCFRLDRAWVGGDDESRDEELVRGACELIAMCMRFGGGSLIFAGTGAEGKRLSHQLNWITLQLHSHSLPCLLNLLTNCIEQCAELLTEQDCGQILSVLWGINKDYVLEAVKRALLYFPDSVFTNPQVPFHDLCDFIIQSFSLEDRTGIKLMSDMLQRTRSGDETTTKWSKHGTTLDHVLLPRIHRILLSLAKFGDDHEYLLFSLLRAYPTWSISSSPMTTLKDLAQRNEPEEFRACFRLACTTNAFLL
ncbi:hypothetical protein BASA81_007550 [Batrachochytrium salamandrivorans]|nr:hypothetical protein BASA81_007550 [Batrachochytrium salamandrivorans]